MTIFYSSDFEIIRVVCYAVIEVYIMENKKSGKSEKPILIFDKEGNLGQAIIESLAEDSLCIYVSGSGSNKLRNVIHVPLTRKIPVLPKCEYKAFVINNSSDNLATELLSFFISKASEDNAHIYFLLNIRDASEDLMQSVLAMSSRITILLAGDLFGGIIKSQSPVIDFLMQSSIGRVVIADPLAYVYPVGAADFLSVIKRLIHIKGVPGHRILYLLPPSPVTSLSFVRELQKKEPSIKVDIAGVHKTDSRTLMPKSYQSVFGLGYDFSKALPVIAIKKPEKVTKRKHKKLPVSKQRAGRLTAVLVMTILITVFGLPILSGLLGVGYLSRTKAYVFSNELDKARYSSRASIMFFSLAQRSMNGITLLSRLGLGERIGSIQAGISAGRLISETAYYGIDGAISLKKILLDESTEPKKDLSIAMQNFKQAVLGASAIKAESKIPDKYYKYLSEIETFSAKAGGMLDVLPEILGMDKKKKYLVLFQNNMELRPGGGFIGSYGVLEMDKGVIKNFPIYDVYDADGQLTKHIEPPFQLRKYMGVNHWYLRDSNFDLDFNKNGQFASFFYNTETKDVVDGVIGIDVTFLRKMLSVTGPLKVIGYNDTVTSENFFKLTESHAQDNFFPGSNQKQNFLTAVANSLSNRLLEEKSVSFARLAEVIVDSIAEKHLLFAFADENIQSVVSAGGASSSLKDTRTEKEGSVNDFLGVNEANLGENKANYYLDRSISHKAELSSEGKLTEMVTVHYVNKSRKSDKFGGDYKSYLRFILPKEAELKAVAFDEKPQNIVPAVTNPAIFASSSYTPPVDGLEIERTEMEGKTVYGFLNVVPMNGKKTVTINYAIQTKTASSGQTFDYSLRVFKQPGTDADAYAFSFINPSGYKVLDMSGSAKANNQGASVLTSLLEDKEITLKLGRR